MEDRSRRSGLVVRESPGAGRGVFAMRTFRGGDVLEIAPVLVVPRSQLEALQATGLRHYVWAWGSSVAVGLGLISLVNHGDPPNARWRADHRTGELTLQATRDIEPGSEILVDYTAGGRRPLRFTPRDRA